MSYAKYAWTIPWAIVSQILSLLWYVLRLVGLMPAATPIPPVGE